MDGEIKMVKTYRVTCAYTGNFCIEVFESGKKVIDVIVNDYDVNGACTILNAFGYRCTKKEY